MERDTQLFYLLKLNYYFFIFKASLCRKLPDLKIDIHCFTYPKPNDTPHAKSCNILQ